MFTLKTIEPSWKINVSASDIKIVCSGNVAHIKGYFKPTNDVSGSWENPVATFEGIKIKSAPYCTVNGADFAIGETGLIAISSLTAGTTF